MEKHLYHGLGLLCAVGLEVIRLDEYFIGLFSSIYKIMKLNGGLSFCRACFFKKIGRLLYVKLHDHDENIQNHNCK